MKYWGVPLLLLALTAYAATEYNRSEWGGWRGGCHDTRNIVLEREAAKGSLEWKTDKLCKVTAGVWYGPYTGELFTNPRELDIDHLVPLKAAYDSGAAGWSQDKKRRYFNDLSYPYHIMAVQSRANRQKGSKGPGGWLPAVGRCQYVEHWLAVKKRWKLTLTAPETQAIIEVIKKCD